MSMIEGSVKAIEDEARMPGGAEGCHKLTGTDTGKTTYRQEWVRGHKQRRRVQGSLQRWQGQTLRVAPWCELVASSV